MGLSLLPTQLMTSAVTIRTSLLALEVNLDPGATHLKVLLPLQISVQNQDLRAVNSPLKTGHPLEPQQMTQAGQ